jgi:aryl-alcohol dehydrogenase-like predicted oxidoreductase
MNYRTLGGTGLQVSELGYGAWGIGKSMWLGADEPDRFALSTGPSSKGSIS